MIYHKHINQSDLTIVVRAKPVNSPPISLIPTNGDILGEIPYVQTILFTQHVTTMVTPILSHARTHTCTHTHTHTHVQC